MGARGDTRKRRKLRAKLALREHECWLCLGYYGPLDFTLPRTDILAVEIDEEIPFSKGGDPSDLGNTHLVHRYCNLKKGSRILPRGAFSNGVACIQEAKPSPSREW